MTGIVLAGGRSRRFGENKAVATVGGRRLIDHVVDLHRSIFDEVIIVSARPTDFLSLGCTVVADLAPERGPLCGIATGLLHASHEHAFVTACDMPFLKKDLLGYLRDRGPGCHAVVPVVSGHLEPLHAVYARSCLPLILESLDRGATRVIDFYAHARVREIGEEELRRYDPDLVSFFNINTRDDLDRAEALFAAVREGSSPGGFSR
jgi:molybdenum cofactor guanylyltransferase